MLHKIDFMIPASFVVMLASCAPSAQLVRRAQTASYQTDFSVVWNAVSQTVRTRYPRIILDDAAKGQLVTDWHLVERTAADEDPAGIQDTSGARVQGGKFFRARIRISTKAPWQVTVEGEAAEFRPGLSMLVPYPRGASDEPPWVDGRIRALQVAIYEKLATHVVDKQE